MMHPMASRKLFLSCIFTILFSSNCYSNLKLGSGVFSSSTRTVFYSNEKEKTIYIHNNNEYPVLVQLWTDSTLHEIEALQRMPLMVIPPIVKLQAHESHAVRIIYTGEELPDSKESIFWLNLQMIPPVPDVAKENNSVLVSVRTRQKIFYRPEKFKGGSTEWIKKLKCNVNEKSPNRFSVHCYNPTEYYATLDKVVYYSMDKEFFTSGKMIEPMSGMDFDLDNSILKSSQDNKKYKKLSIYPINDLGVIQEVVK